jgi:ParB family transcriptional regulator, chromosome partitioning protein
MSAVSKPIKKSSLQSAFASGMALADPITQQTADTELRLELLEPMPRQVRRFFDQEKLEKLSSDIAKRGILQPLLVRPIGARYQIVGGERRWRAAKLAGLERVPVIVRDLTDTEAQQANVIENINRDDINPFEVAIGIFELLKADLNVSEQVLEQVLRRTALIATGRATRESTDPKMLIQVDRVRGFFSGVERWGVASFVNNILPLRHAPADIQRALGEGRLEYTKAVLLMRIEESSARARLLERAIEGLSHRDLKAAVDALVHKPKELHVAVNRLQRRWGGAFTINESKNGGEIRIRCNDRAQFETLLEFLQKAKKS